MSHSSTLLLDDGEYRLWTHADQRRHLAVGVLERRCLISPSTPKGRAVVGSFSLQPDLRWCAQVSAPLEPPHVGGWRRVAVDVARCDAIVALWHARHDAYLAQHCL